MASLINAVRNKRSLSPVVQRLLELSLPYQQQQQNNQNLLNVNHLELNKQSEKRIRSLLRQINKSKHNASVEELEKAILHRDSTTRCVKIPRQAGYEQSRSNPVVEFCRLWRWPDLVNQNELKPVDYCPSAFHYILDHICINPFHYERVPTTYSVYVPRLPPGSLHNMPSFHSSTMNDMSSNQIPQNTTYQAPLQEQPSLPSFSPESITSQDSFLSPCTGASTEESIEATTPMDLDNIPVHNNNPLPQEQAFSCERVAFEEPQEWCRLSYYEMSNRVGEQFCAMQSQVIIDGFTHPSNAERFCLGGLTNVQRTMEIDRARRYIGRGVKLFHIRGNVFAECLSDNPVFVQSPITNRRFSWHPATVCKIPPTVRLKIFDSDDFTEVLSSAVNEGYESVFHLQKMCIIRMSLVKGWGVEYPRQSVTCTPCWLEIHLNGPLQWLDTVLSTMRGPNQSINSGS